MAKKKTVKNVTITEVKKSIKGIMAKKDKLKANLTKLNEGLDKLFAILYFKRYKVQVGSTVKGNDGKLYKVAKIEMQGKIDDKPWIVGHPELKAGGFSEKATRHLYADWEVA